MRSSSHPGVFDLKVFYHNSKRKDQTGMDLTRICKGAFDGGREAAHNNGISCSYRTDYKYLLASFGNLFAAVTENKHVLPSSCFAPVLVTVTQDTHILQDKFL